MPLCMVSVVKLRAIPLSTITTLGPVPISQPRVLFTQSTANWNNTPGDAKWTVPLIFQISQILKIGKQPISLQVGGKYYADSPRYGPSWGVRFNLTMLYPTARPKPGPIPGTYSK